MKNPMAYMMLFTLFVVIVFPKMMNSMDPEVRHLVVAGVLGAVGVVGAVVSVGAVGVGDVGVGVLRMHLVLFRPRDVKSYSVTWRGQRVSTRR